MSDKKKTNTRKLAVYYAIAFSLPFFVAIGVFNIYL